MRLILISLALSDDGNMSRKKEVMNREAFWTYLLLKHLLWVYYMLKLH